MVWNGHYLSQKKEMCAEGSAYIREVEAQKIEEWTCFNKNGEDKFVRILNRLQEAKTDYKKNSGRPNKR